MSSLKSDFFVQFRAFYIKEFTRQKKVTNKLFKTVQCIVIAKRGRGVWSAKWDLVGCVSMWWYMYIEGYIFVFLYPKETGAASAFCPYMTFLKKNSYVFLI